MSSDSFAPGPGAGFRQRDHGAAPATFVLEYDIGSEHLPQLTGKLTGYGRLAQAMAEKSHVCPVLLPASTHAAADEAASQHVHVWLTGEPGQAGRSPGRDFRRRFRLSGMSVSGAKIGRWVTGVGVRWLR